LSNLIRQTAVTGILSVGMVMVIITGQIDLSVGSMVGFAGMAAVLVQIWLHWGLVPSLLTAVGVGVLVGLFQGWLTAYAQIPSFIVTLGGLLAWRGAAKGISGGVTFPISVQSFRALGQAYLGNTTGLVLMVLAVAASVWVVIHQKPFAEAPWVATMGNGRCGVSHTRSCRAGCCFCSRVELLFRRADSGACLCDGRSGGRFVTQNTPFGRYLYAIGGNSEAAKFSGINLRSHILMTFCIIGGLAGVAGVIYTARVGSAGPDAGTLLELDAIAACVIGGASLMGGRGTVLGACLGALFMASLDNGMSLKNVPDFIQDIIKGAILVTAVGLDVVGRQRD